MVLSPKIRPGVISPFAIRFLTRLVLPVMKVLHRPSLKGEEHLPAEPYLLVGNHPTTLGITDFPVFAALCAERFGATRRLAGFAHYTFFHAWPLSWLFPEIGAVPSTYEGAEHAIAEKAALIVFPGGDHEAFRPFWRADKVDLAGRLGFLRIARKAWLPVVPMGFHGITTPVLWRSSFLAWFFVWPRVSGVKRFGLTVLAVLGVAAILYFVPLAWPWRALLAWVFAGSPFALFPILPTTIRIRIGPPLSPETLFGSRDADDGVLSAALGRVEAAIQSQVDAR